MTLALLPFLWGVSQGVNLPVSLSLTDLLPLGSKSVSDMESVTNEVGGGGHLLILVGPTEKPTEYLPKLKQQLRFWRCKGKVSTKDSFSQLDESSGQMLKVGYITSLIEDHHSDLSMGLAMIRRSALKEKVLYLSDNSRKVFIEIPSSFV